MTMEASKDPTYLMGRSEAETRRLMAAARILNPFTRRMLRDAGLAEGMSVLDVGTGPGDVALLAADLVGSSGTVYGIDQNPEVLETARFRAEAVGLTNVGFGQGDLRDTAFEGDFEAVVGRLVLMYVADPADTLRSLARCLKPGGIVAFQDFNLAHESVRTSPTTPLWEQTWGWFVAAARNAGIPAEMGFGLRHAFLDAGLPAPEMRLESAVLGGHDSFAYEWMAETLRSVLPLVVRFGIATEEEVDIDTLAARLRAETVEVSGVVKGPDMVSAWARVP